MMISGANRALPKISVTIGNAAQKIVASVGNTFRLGMDGKRALMFSCINCSRRRVLVAGRGVLGVQVRPAAVKLSRIIIMNCNARSGHAMASTVDGISKRALGTAPVGAIKRKLGNGVTNMHICGRGGAPNTRTAFLVHNNSSVDRDGSPLVLISNMRHDATNVGPGSVRSVRILGSTTSSTVCNSHTSGKIILVAAEGKGDNTPQIAFRTSFTGRGIRQVVRCLSTARTIAVVHSH